MKLSSDEQNNAVWCVVGAGDFASSAFTVPKKGKVVAADAGLNHLRDAGVTPDVVLGDFDSYGKLPDLPGAFVFPAEKDDTDTALALKMGLEEGYRIFWIYGATGGKRPAHTLANLQSLCMLSRMGAEGFLLLPSGQCVTALTDGEMSFSSGLRGYISVFAMGEAAEGVSLRGLKYPLTDGSLSPYEPLGVSNEFTGVPASVSVKKGTLLLWFCGKPEDVVFQKGESN